MAKVPGPRTKVMHVGRPTWYYTNATLSANYVQKSFGFDAATILVKNDSDDNAMQFSWDSLTLDGDVMKRESQAFGGKQESSMYIKGTSGQTCRLWAW